VKYLVDSDIVADALKSIVYATDLLKLLYPAGVAISIVTYSEIYEGIYGSYDPRPRERNFRAFLRGVAVLPCSRAVARRNAMVRRQQRQLKRPVTQRGLDIVIAATALEHELELVTRNARYYSDIPNLKLYHLTTV
jgi:predicted nucleic acid-binding protein